MLPLTFSIYALGVPLTHLYTTDPLAVEASVLVTLFSLLGTPMTTGTVIYTAVWQGLGNARLPFYATSIGMWCIRIWNRISDGDCAWLGLARYLGRNPFG